MQKLKKVIHELVEMFEELNRVEEKKKEAILKDRPVEVEEIMKQEQALTLRFKSCEKKVEELLCQEGQTGKNLKEVLDSLGRDQREELLPDYEKLKEELSSYQEIRMTVNELLNVKLYNIKRKLEEHGEIYSADGRYKERWDKGRVRRG